MHSIHSISKEAFNESNSIADAAVKRTKQKSKIINAFGRFYELKDHKVFANSQEAISVETTEL